MVRAAYTLAWLLVGIARIIVNGRTLHDGADSDKRFEVGVAENQVVGSSRSPR